MRSAKAIALGICAVLLVAISGMAIAAENNAFVCDTCDTDNAIGGSVGKSTYTFEIGPGGSWSTDSTLYDDAPADYDVYVMKVTEPCKVTVTVEDCCIMGDTMGLKAGRRILRATSPEVITASKKLEPGTYKFFVGYLDCPGGYPAGYSTYVSAS